jgi:DNA-binding protein Fis
VGGADAPRDAPASLETLIDEELNQGRNGLYAKSLACMESLLLTRVLEHTHGNQSLAARLLSISRSSLRNKLHQLHIAIIPVAGTQEEPLDEDITQKDSILRLRTGSD